MKPAYHHGYFERPRRSSATEVAEPPFEATTRSGDTGLVASSQRAERSSGITTNRDLRTAVRVERGRPVSSLPSQDGSLRERSTVAGH